MAAPSTRNIVPLLPTAAATTDPVKVTPTVTLVAVKTGSTW